MTALSSAAGLVQVRTRACRLKNGSPPFALDWQDWRHRSDVWLRRWRGDRLDVLGLRSSAHEQVIDYPLRAVTLAAQRKPIGDRGGCVEISIGTIHPDTKFIPRHLGRTIDDMPLV